MPVEHWHESIGDPTLADAILDRLLHNAHRIALKGKSKRKREYPALGSDDGSAVAGADKPENTGRPEEKSLTDPATPD